MIVTRIVEEGSACMTMKKGCLAVRSLASGAWQNEGEEVEIVFMLRKKGCTEAVRKVRKVLVQ